jgi:ABC-type Fe3+/spermidine/putrescine transport system ATPase subunit
MVSVELKNVVKRYGATTAVDGVSLTIGKGELFFLLGPSGCGKTTALRMLAGFITPDAGEILFDGRDISRTPPHRRNVGMVFQTYALFPHLTVAQNISYGLRFRKLDAPEKKRRLDDVMERTRLAGLGARTPAELSGGQQQRVALARALIIQPDVLLLDEPLSNLDTKLRVEVREEIKRIHEEFKITALYVTHDQDEALSLADRMAIMKDGVIEQIGAPAEIYARPRNAFVAGFVGETNLLEARPALRDGRAGYDTLAGWIPAPGGVAPKAGNALLSVRPESLRIGPPGEAGAVSGKVLYVKFFGGTVKIGLALESGATLAAAAPGAGVAGRWKKGDTAGITVEARDVAVLE